MSPWWLIIIVPVSAGIGMLLSALLTANAQDERCANCYYRKEKSE